MVLDLWLYGRLQVSVQAHQHVDGRMPSPPHPAPEGQPATHPAGDGQRGRLRLPSLVGEGVLRDHLGVPVGLRLQRADGLPAALQQHEREAVGGRDCR